MKCIKCKKEIQDGSIYCNFCGKKQAVTKAKYHKREHGTGTIRKDNRNKKQWVALAPMSRYSKERVYLGSYGTRQEAQSAIDEYIRDGRPGLYNATLADVYKLWSDAHYKQVGESAIALYCSMWKRFERFYDAKFKELRTAHFQQVVNSGTSHSACNTLKAMSVMLSSYAMQNDIVQKNYAEFVKLPKFEKKEKNIFTKEDICKLWENSDDENVQVILFMIYTGFRIGEILNLKKSNIFLDSGYIIGGIKTKAGKNRVVPIPSSIPELKIFINNFIESSETDLIFNISASEFRKIFSYTLTKYGISTKLTPHNTRHTFASLCSSAGISAENLQKIIGHANFATTADIYIHQNFSTLSTEMSKLKK